MKRKEGHYTIKVVDKLPKRGNSNWLYTLEKDNMSIYHLWEGTDFKKLDISESINAEPTVIDSGTNVTVSGTGTSTDPYIFDVISVELVQEPICVSEAPKQTVTFTKTDNADVNDPLNRDIIIPSVLEITRGNNQSIYNIAVETGFDFDLAPAYTRWAVGNIYQPLAELNFLPFYEANDFQIGQNVVGTTFVVEVNDTVNPIQYFEVTFNSWTQGNAGGGFSYTRTVLLSVAEQAALTLEEGYVVKSYDQTGIENIAERRFYLNEVEITEPNTWFVCNHIEGLDRAYIPYTGAQENVDLNDKTLSIQTEGNTTNDFIEINPEQVQVYDFRESTGVRNSAELLNSRLTFDRTGSTSDIVTSSYRRDRIRFEYGSDNGTISATQIVTSLPTGSGGYSLTLPNATGTLAITQDITDAINALNIPIPNVINIETGTFEPRFFCGNAAFGAYSLGQVGRYTRTEINGIAYCDWSFRAIIGVPPVGDTTGIFILYGMPFVGAGSSRGIVNINQFEKSGISHYSIIAKQGQQGDPRIDFFVKNALSDSYTGASNVNFGASGGVATVEMSGRYQCGTGNPVNSIVVPD